MAAAQPGSRRLPKAAMLIAQRIIHDALRADLHEGDLLESEKTMLERYQIGRGTLREALRLLEFQGVISLKPGPGGGPVLQIPDATHLGSTLVLLLRMRSAPFSSLIELRATLEPIAGRMAATRMSKDELKELHDAVLQMENEIDDQYSFLDTNRRFHDIIAWGSGNVLFAYILESLLGILDGTVLGFDYQPHRRAAILKEHFEIYDALAARDADATENLMREHIKAFENFAKRKYPQMLKETIPWEQRYLM